MSMTNDHMLYGYRGRQLESRHFDDSEVARLGGTGEVRADERRAKRALMGQMTRVAGSAVVTFVARQLASWFGRTPPHPVPSRT